MGCLTGLSQSRETYVRAEEVVDLMSESRQRLNRVHFAGFGPPRRRCRGGERRITKKTHARTYARTYVRIYRIIGAKKIIAEDVLERSSPTSPTSPTEERPFGMVAISSDNGQVAEIPRRDACPQSAPPPSFPDIFIKTQ